MGGKGEGEGKGEWDLGRASAWGKGRAHRARGEEAQMGPGPHTARWPDACRGYLSTALQSSSGDGMIVPTCDMALRGLLQSDACKVSWAGFGSFCG